MKIQDDIYLPANTYISIQGDLSAIGGSGIPIPVRVASYSLSGGKFAQAQTEEQAKAAEKAFTVIGGELPVYADGKALYYGEKAKIQISQDLPAERIITAGTSCVLQTEATADPEDAGTLVYTWYRCNDENGAGAERLDAPQGVNGNTLQLDSCTEGIYYFYCEISMDSGKADPVKTTVMKLSVSRFVPAYKAIEKVNAIR